MAQNNNEIKETVVSFIKFFTVDMFKKTAIMVLITDLTVGAIGGIMHLVEKKGEKK